MKLAEALLLRADRNRTLEQLKQRIQVSARYQEGEKPPEDARDLVVGGIGRARRARGPDPQHQPDQLGHRHGRRSDRHRCARRARRAPAQVLDAQGFGRSGIGCASSRSGSCGPPGPSSSTCAPST